MDGTRPMTLEGMCTPPGQLQVPRGDGQEPSCTLSYAP